MNAKRQNTAKLIAEALWDIEADPAVKALPVRARAKIARLHRRLHEAVQDHGSDLGLEVQPLSGGTPKPAL